MQRKICLDHCYSVGKFLKVFKHITAHSECWTNYLSPLIKADFEGVLRVPPLAIWNKCCFLVPSCFLWPSVNINNLNPILIFLWGTLFIGQFPVQCLVSMKWLPTQAAVKVYCSGLPSRYNVNITCKSHLEYGGRRVC